MFQVSYNPTTYVNRIQSTKVAGFHFSLCEVIQKGPNLLNGPYLQLKLWLEAGMRANRKVSFSHKKNPNNKTRNMKKEKPRGSSCLLQQIMS